MKRRFCDLYVAALLDDRDRAAHVLQEAIRLGYKRIGLTIDNPNHEDISKLLKVKNSLSSEFNIDIVTRIHLTLRNEAKIKKILRLFRRKIEIVSVEPHSASMLAFASRDRRIDIISINPFYELKFKKGIVENIQNLDKALEIILAYIDVSSLSLLKLSRVLSRYSELIRLVSRKGLSLIASSGARSPRGLKQPRSVACLLNVLGLEYSFALDAISLTPNRLVERNRFKLSRSFVMPGVVRADDGGSGWGETEQGT